MHDTQTHLPKNLEKLLQLVQEGPKPLEQALILGETDGAFSLCLNDLGVKTVVVFSSDAEQQAFANKAPDVPAYVFSPLRNLSVLKKHECIIDLSFLTKTAAKNRLLYMYNLRALAEKNSRIFLCVENIDREDAVYEGFPHFTEDLLRRLFLPNFIPEEVIMSKTFTDFHLPEYFLLRLRYKPSHKTLPLFAKN